MKISQWKLQENNNTKGSIFVVIYTYSVTFREVQVKLKKAKVLYTGHLTNFKPLYGGFDGSSFVPSKYPVQSTSTVGR